MKKLILLIALISTVVFACKKKDDNPAPANQEPARDTVVIFKVYGSKTGGSLSLNYYIDDSTSGNTIFSADTSFTYSQGHTSSNPQYVVLPLKGAPKTGGVNFRSEYIYVVTNPAIVATTADTAIYNQTLTYSNSETVSTYNSYKVPNYSIIEWEIK